VRRARHRRALSRPVLVGTAALAVVLAAVVALAAVRGRTDRPPVGPAPTSAPTTAPTSTSVSTDRWKSYTDHAHNLRLRYPPDWMVRPRNQEGMVTLAPPEHARRALATSPPFAVTVIAGGGYYLGEAPEPGTTWGRLPGGQAYLRYGSGPARPWDVSYSIDWGRDSAKPVTPTRASHGDRSRPACRSDQWRLVWPGEYGFAGPQRFFLSGAVQYLGGAPCHLRARLELLVERDGRRLPLPGNPATSTVEGDLPRTASPKTAARG
jgi:hypothetical protein